MENQKLQELVKQLQNNLGQGAIMILGQQNNLKLQTFSSGSLLIDQALGVNGFPKGKIIEIFGPESAGKTTLALHAIAEMQKQKGICALVDVEHAIDPNYAKAVGVDINRLLISQPNSGEEALQIVDILVKSGEIDLIVIDSVAALVPKEELAGDMLDKTIGAQARLMSKALRKIAIALTSNKTTIIFLNQIRMKVGIIFGNPEVTPGGQALKFFAAIRLEIRRVANISNSSIIGNIVRVKIVKNKLAPPFKTIKTEIYFGKGINRQMELINLAEKYNLLERKGSWYCFQGKNLIQGKNNLQILLNKDATFANKFKKLVLTKFAENQT